MYYTSQNKKNRTYDKLTEIQTKFSKNQPKFKNQKKIGHMRIIQNLAKIQ